MPERPGRAGGRSDTELIDTEFSDPIAEVRLLRRQVQRERARRQAAESLGERVTRDLYESVRQLRSAQSELLERADRSRVVNELARSLRHDHDTGRLLQRAAEAVGRTISVDRASVLLVDPQPGTTGAGAWTSETCTELPRPVSFAELPVRLRTLLSAASASIVPVEIEDVTTDRRFDADSADKVDRLIGARSMIAVPVAVANQVTGWMLLQSVAARSWEQREIAICEGLSHDLVATLVQVQAFEQQRESVRRLQELDEAKDAFVSTVSHELRTPLTSIVGYLELMADGGMGDLSDEVSAGLSIIERNVIRLRSLVEDLLTLSAYDGSRGPREGRPVDLAAIVVECLQSMRPTIANAGLEVDLELDPTLGDVMGDVMDFERVMSNLLNNAIKFTQPGGRITVRLTQQRQMAVLVVSDTGIGIPDDEQERLFSRFFRSSLAIADEIQGTGLGLSLVQAVVDSYGGTIGVDSEVGKGTSFTVRLPLSTA
jgi:two-component system phosphate regulon sensor histidine kinase PhoR